jgi:leader peptidase (prepilin peptidase) / N-methyltransferase
MRQNHPAPVINAAAYAGADGESVLTGDRPARVLLLATDRRFRTFASASLTRRGYHVTAPNKRIDDVELLAVRACVDVAVIDATASLTAAARTAARLQAARPLLGIVAVSDDPQQGLSAFPVLSRWGSFSSLCAAIDQARADGEARTVEMPAAETRMRLQVGMPAAAVPGLAAVMAGLTLAVYPLGASAAISAFVAAVLVVIAAIDIRSLKIPNRIVLPATASVLLADMIFLPGQATEFLLAALLAGAVLLLPNLISASLMGMGDVKLGVLLGAALGWGVVGALEIAFIATLPVAIALLIRGGRGARKAALPFGPFMAVGALVVMIVPRLVGLGG